MINVFMPHDTDSFTGGGSTFVLNLKNGVSDEINFITDLERADILFVPGVTLCSKETFERALERNIPIITRVDNIPEDHRNRGTGISRLRSYTQKSHFVVFQSEWSKHVVGQIVGNNGVVIYNGVDEKIFHPDESKRETKPTFIYVKHSRNECKRFQEAQTLFREYARKNDAKLIIVGTYEKDLEKYNFGFFDGEDIEYKGMLSPVQLAEQYKRAHVLLFPSYGDSCPNVVLEAMASGCHVVYQPWGGTKELVGDVGWSCADVTQGSNEPMSPYDVMQWVVQRQKEFPDLPRQQAEKFTLRHMCQEYESLFKLACLK